MMGPEGDQPRTDDKHGQGRGGVAQHGQRAVDEPRQPPAGQEQRQTDDHRDQRGVAQQPLGLHGLLPAEIVRAHGPAHEVERRHEHHRINQRVLAHGGDDHGIAHIAAVADHGQAGQHGVPVVLLPAEQAAGDHPGQGDGQAGQREHPRQLHHQLRVGILLQLGNNQAHLGEIQHKGIQRAHALLIQHAEPDRDQAAEHQKTQRKHLQKHRHESVSSSGIVDRCTRTLYTV